MDKDQTAWEQSKIETLPDTPKTFIEALMSAPADYQLEEPDWELIDLVQSAVECVTQPHRMLLKLVFYDRCTYNEITEMMGYSSKSHTWYHVQKAVGMLREILLTDPTIKERYDNHTESN
jgi:DNA-directed RNA polymerase specialized sigma24 family protein